MSTAVLKKEKSVKNIIMKNVFAVHSTRYSVLKASTMLEVIAAMVIIMVIFAVATSMFVKITASGFTLEKINANLLLNNKAIDTKLKQDFKEYEIKEGEITIKKHIKPYGSNASLVLLHLEAFDNANKKMADRKELVLIEK